MTQPGRYRMVDVAVVVLLLMVRMVRTGLRYTAPTTAAARASSGRTTATARREGMTTTTTITAAESVESRCCQGHRRRRRRCRTIRRGIGRGTMVVLRGC